MPRLFEKFRKIHWKIPGWNKEKVNKVTSLIKKLSLSESTESDTETDAGSGLNKKIEKTNKEELKSMKTWCKPIKV